MYLYAHVSIVKFNLITVEILGARRHVFSVGLSSYSMACYCIKNVAITDILYLEEKRLIILIAY